MNKSVDAFQVNGFGLAIINMTVPVGNAKTNKDQPEGEKLSEWRHKWSWALSAYSQEDF